VIERLPDDFPDLRDRIASLFADWATLTDARDVPVERIDAEVANLKLDPPHAINLLGVAAAEALEKKPEAAVNVTLRISGSKRPPTRALSAVIISQLARYQPGIWMDLVKLLARDDKWEVRDFAARIFDNQKEGLGLAEFHLEFTLEALGAWTRDPDYLIRRLPTRAMLNYAAEHPDVVPRLLGLLDPLYNDPSEYVRRNLVSALRAIGRSQPEPVFEQLEARARSGQGHAAEVIRLTLDSGFARKHPDRANDLLARLNGPSTTT